jgi:hypothetical protein
MPDPHSGLTGVAVLTSRAGASKVIDAKIFFIHKRLTQDACKTGRENHEPGILLSLPPFKPMLQDKVY